MRLIASSVIVLAAAWMWQTTVALNLMPSARNDFMILFNAALSLTTLICGLKGFLMRDPAPSKEKSSPSFTAPHRPAPLPPQSVASFTGSDPS
jgi:hypothetical protein